MKRVFIALSAVVGIAGCTWNHPYKGESEFYSDKYDCEMQVNSRTPQQRQISPQESVQEILCKQSDFMTSPRLMTKPALLMVLRVFS